MKFQTEAALRKAFSEEIESAKNRLAAELVDEQYRSDPELLERWGERGRAKSLDDAAHNLSFLAEAVALGDTAVFARYILWLDKVLAGAGLPRSVLAGHLELLGAGLNKNLSKACAEAAGAHIEAALAALKSAGEKKDL